MLAPLCAVIVTWAYSMLNCLPTWQGSMCPLAIRENFIVGCDLFHESFLSKFCSYNSQFFSSLLPITTFLFANFGSKIICGIKP